MPFTETFLDNSSSADISSAPNHSVKRQSAILVFLRNALPSWSSVAIAFLITNSHGYNASLHGGLSAVSMLHFITRLPYGEDYESKSAVKERPCHTCHFETCTLLIFPPWYALHFRFNALFYSICQNHVTSWAWILLMKREVIAVPFGEVLLQECSMVQRSIYRMWWWTGVIEYAVLYFYMEFPRDLQRFDISNNSIYPSLRYPELTVSLAMWYKKIGYRKWKLARHQNFGCHYTWVGMKLEQNSKYYWTTWPQQ